MRWTESLSSRMGIAGDLLLFFWERKWWWLTPMILVLLLFGGLIILPRVPLSLRSSILSSKSLTVLKNTEAMRAPNRIWLIAYGL